MKERVGKRSLLVESEGRSGRGPMARRCQAGRNPSLAWTQIPTEVTEERDRMVKGR
jgi:hypothetical protein